MVKLPFVGRNKKSKSDLPKEVQDYYQAEKRERVGVAGLLALATLVVTVLLAMGLFFGGRWAYRTIFDNNDEPQTAQNENQEESQESENGDQPDDQQDTDTQEPQTSPEPSPSPSPAPDPTPEPTNPTPEGGSGSGNSDDLPSTGPADTAAIVAAVAAISGGAYYAVRRPQER